MAQLNVREHRVEATIAYVGPRLAGTATNLAQLRAPREAWTIGDVAAASSDDALAFVWQPRDRERLHDCDVLVRVVSPRLEPGALVDVDGVVLVADARPDAQPGNRAALEMLRAELARAERPRVPIVVQVNKVDLPEALAPDAVIAALDAELPHVAAAAARGDGVFETLEAAFEALLEALREDAPQAAGATEHPLLDALRAVLRDAVREQVEELEARRDRRAEDAIQEALTRLGRIESRIAASEAGIAAVRSDVERLRADAERGRSAAEGASTRVLSAISALADANADANAERASQTEAHAAAGRDHVTATAAQLKKLLLGLSSEIRTTDARSSANEATLAVKDLSRRSDDLAGRIDRVERATAERAARLEESLGRLRTEVVAAVASGVERADATSARVDELIEELKKPKKGWFT